jgi:hypothetical protein
MQNKNAKNILLMYNSGLATRPFQSTNISQIFSKPSSTGTTLWNCQACSTDGTCAFAPANFTVKSIIQNSVSYNTITNAGNVETFILNVTTNDLNAISFYYNNTAYPVSLTNVGNNYIATSTLNVPTVSTVTNKTFFWNLIVSTGSINTTAYNQTINVISIDNCTVNSIKVLNLTLYDQETQILIPNGAVGNGTIDVSVNLYPINKYSNNNFLVSTYSNSFNQTNNANICIQTINSSSYYLDATINSILKKCQVYARMKPE